MVKLREPTVEEIEARAHALCEADPPFHIEQPDKHRDLTWDELDESQKVGFRGLAREELRDEIWGQASKNVGWPFEEL